MSLGGGVQGPHDFLAEASNGAAAAGVVVVTSAGNEGPDEYTVGSPGSASDVISVGATTNSRGMGVEIRVGEDTYNAVPGSFPNFTGTSYNVEDWPGSDNEACTSDVPEGSLGGVVVLISRGTCVFIQKVANAKLAGAVGVIVYNHQPGDPFGMGTTEGFEDDIPAVMVSLADGLDLEAIDSRPFSAVITPNELADFSSWGPAPFTGILKPDLVAPGVNILSSVFFGWELFNGTSMASPHVAGAAAILLQSNSDWEPWQVKSALATTATDLELPVWQQGSGIIDIDAALDTNAFFAPTNASFGVFNGKKPVSGSVLIDVYGDCDDPDWSSDDGFFSATLEGGDLVVELAGGREIGTGNYGGIIEVTCGEQTHSIPYLAVVERKG